MFSILFPTVTLLVVSTYASPTPKTSNPAHLNHLEARQCGFAGWDSSNLDNWKAADTDAVFEKWWQTYLGGNSDTTSSVIPNGWPNRFANLFGRMYLNGREVYECSKTTDVCYDDVPCEDIHCSGNWAVGCEDKDAGRPIYLIMRSLQGYQDYFKEYIEALDQSQLNFEGMRAYLANNFFPSPKDAHVLFLKEFFAALGTIFGIAGGYAKFIPFIAATDGRKEAAGSIAAILGGIGNGYATTVSAPKDPRFDNFDSLGVYMTNVMEQVRTSLNDMQFNLAVGKQWDNKYFYEYAKGGAFLPGPGPSASTPGGPLDAPSKILRQYLTRQFNARAINYIWRTQKIFITYTTDVDGSCEQDKQGPQDLKYCRPGDPGVYYMYWWNQQSVDPKFFDTFATGKLDHPMGWDKLAAGWVDPDYQLDLKDVFESSIAAFQAGGLNYDGKTAIERAMSAVRDQWANPWDKGTQWEGTFTIPICNTGNTSYNVQLGDRIMPCNCGGDGSQVEAFKNATMPGYGVYDEQCTPGKIAARELERRGGGKGNLPSDTPSLPTDVNQIACLTDNSPVQDMVTHITYCQEAIRSLGDDMNKQICTDNCQDGGDGLNSKWCRVAVDDSNIHFCALTIATKDQAHGGPGTSCISVGDANTFLLNAQATKEDGGVGCHPVGTPDFAATFLVPDGMSRWCLSDYEHANYCTV